MKIINRSRVTGKTTQLIYASEANEIPIVTHNPKYIIDLAKKLGCNIPEPISIDKYIRSYAGNTRLSRFPRYYVDDLECIIDFILPNVDAVTTSIGKENVKDVNK